MNEAKEKGECYAIKRLGQIVGKGKLISEEFLTVSEQKKFASVSIRSFFAGESYIGRHLTRFLGKPSNPVLLLCQMRRHYLETGQAKGREEADSLVEKKLQLTIRNIKGIDKRLYSQRTKDPKMANQVSYHLFKNCLCYIANYADLVLELLREKRRK